MMVLTEKRWKILPQEKENKHTNGVTVLKYKREKAILQKENTVH
jgi:hypothetical protein